MEKIKDCYCNGYFGRRYDLYNAVIIDESRYTITIQTEKEGDILTAAFEDPMDKEEMRKQWTSGI